MIDYIINLDFNYPVVMFVFIFLLCSTALSFLYLLWKTFVFVLESFVDSRLVDLNKQKDRLWLAAEDLYDAIDELKERTWDYEANRKELRKLSECVSDLEDYVLNDINKGSL